MSAEVLRCCTEIEDNHAPEESGAFSIQEQLENSIEKQHQMEADFVDNLRPRGVFEDFVKEEGLKPVLSSVSMREMPDQELKDVITSILCDDEQIRHYGFIVDNELIRRGWIDRSELFQACQKEAEPKVVEPEYRSFPLFIFRGYEKCPTISGVAIDPRWLDAMPESKNPEKKNNHHLAYEASVYIPKTAKIGRSALFAAFRNLEFNQIVMPVDQHDWAHKNLAMPDRATAQQAYDRVHAGFENDERFNFGSANKPNYKVFTAEHMAKIDEEFHLHKRML